MGAEVEFQLHPNGVLHAKMLAVIVIVLEPNFGKLARREGEVGRKSGPFTPKNIERVKRAGVACDILAAQPRHPTRLESPQELRIKAPIAQGLSRQQRAGIRFEPAVERLGLPGDKWESGMGNG